MTDKRHALGRMGEDMAADHLVGKGMKILERRVRCRHGEIDLVARDGREWVFIEVKTRSSSRMGTAVEALTPKKIGRFTSAVVEYVSRHGLEREPIRCDMVAIDAQSDGGFAIVHYPASIPMQ